MQGMKLPGLRKRKHSLVTLDHELKKIARPTTEGISQGRGWRTDRGARLAARAMPSKVFDANPTKGQANGQENIPSGDERPTAGTTRASIDS